MKGVYFQLLNTWQHLCLIEAPNDFHYICQSNCKKEKTIIEIYPTQWQTVGMISGFSSQWWHGSSCFLGS